MPFFSMFMSGLLRAVFTLMAITGSPAADRMVLQDFIGYNWDIADGLPSARVSALARTADGYIWLATPKGLTRFDGVRFVKVPPDDEPGLAGAAVRSLLTRRDGSLWIGSERGTLFRRSGKRFIKVDTGTALDGKAILTLAEDAAGGLWIGTDGAGIFSLKDGIIAGFTPANSKLPGLRVTQMTLDSDDRLWFFSNGRLCRIENGAIEPPSGYTVLPSPGMALTPSHDGGLWVATEGKHYGGTRIFHLVKGQSTELAPPYPWPENSVRSRTYAIQEDGSGRLWCATDGGGVFFHLPRGEWRKLDTRMPLSHADGLCFMLDESDSLWLGTRNSGLHHIRPQPPITVLHLPAEFDQNIVQSVCVRRVGTVWAGTDTAGLFRWQDGEPTHFGKEQGLADPRISAVIEDGRGNLWVGTMGGLFRLENETFVAVRSHAALRHRGISDVLDDGATGVWIATLQGVVHLAEGPPKYFGKESGIPNGLIRTLALDPEGRLLVVVSGIGVFRQNGEHFEILTPPQSAAGPQPRWNEGPAAHARTLLHDTDGSLWVATHGFGLWHLRADETDQWTTEQDGLPSNHLFGIQEDSSGNLWLSSESGIFGTSKQSLSRSPEKLGALPSFSQLTTADGLASKVCTGLGRSASGRSPDGLLWFANGPAIAGFDPANLSPAPIMRQPIIEEVVVDGIPVPRSSEPIRIASGVRTFEVHYTSPNPLFPERQRFRFQLEGLDREWVEAGNSRVAYFNHLAPGDYAFRVAVAASDDSWREMPEPLRFEVVPRFYERPTVKTAAGLLLLAAVGGTAWRIERSRSRRRLEHLRVQRAMDQERQRIARDIHDDLGSGLTEIILLSDNLREIPSTSGETRETVDAISSKARRLTRSMDEVVWAVNPGNDTLEGFANYLNDFAQELLSCAGIRFRWAAPPELADIALSAETRHSLYLACKEAIHNATRHAGATEVLVRIEFTNQDLHITIEDNGQGFSDDLPESSRRGLGNMHERLREIGGTCEISRRPGQGTRVMFSLGGHHLKTPHHQTIG